MQKTKSDLLVALSCLCPSQDMELYRLILAAWNKLTIDLLQRTRNIQTIAEDLVYNRTRVGKLLPKAKWSQFAMPKPCGPTHV